MVERKRNIIFRVRAAISYCLDMRAHLVLK